MPTALQTAIWFRNAQWMLSECHRRFGDTFHVRIAHEGTWVFVTDPEDVKKVFTGRPEDLHAGEANHILLPVVGPNSVLLLDRQEHMEQRRLLLPPFHGERMRRYNDLMTEITVAEIERWPRGRPFALRPSMQAITLEIILGAVFGVREGRYLEPLRDSLRKILDVVTDPRKVVFLLVLGPERIRNFGPFRRDLERVDELIRAVVEERRREDDLDERDDILSLLLQATHEDGSSMSHEELRDELITLLTAGHETTATALAWALERLVRHPAKLDRLRGEVEAGETAYLDATIQETLRLRPVISLVNRTLKRPMEFGGYELPAGVKVAPCIFLLHRRPDIYPEPERFLPERFLDESPGTYTWIPFGGGVRRCLGAAFAQFEMQIVLREIVTRVELAPSRSGDEPNLRRAITETPRHDAEVLVS